MIESVPGPRPPVLLGCAAIATLVFVAVVVAGSCIVFAESGANDGSVTMDHIAVYPPDTITRRADHGFYVVGLPGGDLVAFSDLDAANRAASGRRCRVTLFAGSDPALAEALEAFGDRIGPEAEGTPLLLYEECNGALYDVAGIRVDANGRNLDRFALEIDDQERLVVLTARRTCSERTEDEFAVPVEC